MSQEIITLVLFCGGIGCIGFYLGHRLAAAEALRAIDCIKRDAWVELDRLKREQYEQELSEVTKA